MSFLVLSRHRYMRFQIGPNFVRLMHSPKKNLERIASLSNFQRRVELPNVKGRRFEGFFVWRLSGGSGGNVSEIWSENLRKRGPRIKEEILFLLSLSRDGDELIGGVDEEELAYNDGDFPLNWHTAANTYVMRRFEEKNNTLDSVSLSSHSLPPFSFYRSLSISIILSFFLFLPFSLPSTLSLVLPLSLSLPTTLFLPFSLYHSHSISLSLSPSLYFSSYQSLSIILSLFLLLFLSPSLSFSLSFDHPLFLTLSLSITCSLWHSVSFSLSVTLYISLNHSHSQSGGGAQGESVHWGIWKMMSKCQTWEWGQERTWSWFFNFILFLWWPIFRSPKKPNFLMKEIWIERNRGSDLY